MTPELNNAVYVAVISVIFYLLWSNVRRPKHFPPGPFLLPLLGNVTRMSTDVRQTFRTLRKQYGAIFSIYVFNQPVIVLNGYSAIREALVNNAEVFSHRPHSFISDYLLKGRGIVGTSGKVWREQRRFALSALNGVEVAKPLMEAKILQEVTQFLDVLVLSEGEAVDCRNLVASAVGNIICSIMFGKRFEYTDVNFQAVLKRMEENVENLGSASILNVLPAVRFLPGDLFGFKRILENVKFTEEVLVNPVIEKYLSGTSVDQPTNFVEGYIKEMNHRQSSNEDTSMNVDNLRSVILDIFGTGSETITTTILWCLVYLLNDADVQDKCFREIENVIGLERPPSLNDRPNLPYIEATISEVLRHANIVPIAVPHTVPYDVKFRDFVIPKGVLVLPVLDSVLHDLDLWTDPEVFRPERFLDETGRYQKRDELIPFSMGRRACLGEPLSHVELFLFIVSLLQRFSLQCDEATPSLEPHVGIVYTPRPFSVKFISRLN